MKRSKASVPFGQMESVRHCLASLIEVWIGESERRKWFLAEIMNDF
jgi:hypothetical protein